VDCRESVESSIPAGSVHHDPVVPHASLPPVFIWLFLLRLDLYGLLFVVVGSWGGSSRSGSTSGTVLLFSFPLVRRGTGKSCGASLPSGIPRHWETGMRGVRPRNLEIVEGLKTSTLNERTRSCISPSCHSWDHRGTLVSTHR
jgi:hypothetical protein